MNYYTYLFTKMNERSVTAMDGLFRESAIRRVSKGQKGGGQFAEKPETAIKKDAADLLDKHSEGESENHQQDLLEMLKAAVAKGELPKTFMEKFKAKKSGDKIYAVSDIHHSGIEGITDKESGTIVLAGDFMDKAKKHEDFQNAEKWWHEKFLPWCEEHKDQSIVIIGGNCDKWLYNNRDKVQWPSNVHYLDDSAAEVNGMKVYGTSWCPHNMNGAWEVSEEQMEKEFSKIPYGLDILVTHAPPKGEGLELDFDKKNGGNFGSEALLKAILEKKPKIVLCGHIHRGSHKPVKIGDSIVMNVSRVDGDRYEQGFHGRRIGVERADNGLGFLVDMDYDGKVVSPAKVAKLLHRAAKSINYHIGLGDNTPNKEAIDDVMAAEKAISELPKSKENDELRERFNEIKESAAGGFKQQIGIVNLPEKH